MGSFIADAILRRTASASFTSDAVLVGTTGGFTADAVLRRASVGSLTADAVLTDALVVAGSFTANAVIGPWQTIVSTLSIDQLTSTLSIDRLVSVLEVPHG